MNQPKVCPTCHRVILPKKPDRLCGDCGQVIRRHEHWHVGPDSRIRHNQCPPRIISSSPNVRKVTVRQDQRVLFTIDKIPPLTIWEAAPALVDEQVRKAEPERAPKLPAHVPLQNCRSVIGPVVTLAEIKKGFTYLTPLEDQIEDLHCK